MKYVIPDQNWPAPLRSRRERRVLEDSKLEEALPDCDARVPFPNNRQGLNASALPAHLRLGGT